MSELAAALPLIAWLTIFHAADAAQAIAAFVLRAVDSFVRDLNNGVPLAQACMDLEAAIDEHLEDRTGG